MKYRRFHGSVWYDPDFLQLTIPAQLMVRACKDLLERAGIGILEDPLICRIGKVQHIEQLDDVFHELAADQHADIAGLDPHWWVRRETHLGMTMYWLRNGLRFEGNIGPKGVSGILNYLNELPRGFRLVDEFRHYYRDVLGEPPDTHRGIRHEPVETAVENSPEKGIGDRVSHRVSHRVSSRDVFTRDESESENENDPSEARARPREDGGMAPLFDLWARHYPVSPIPAPIIAQQSSSARWLLSRYGLEDIEQAMRGIGQLLPHRSRDGQPGEPWDLSTLKTKFARALAAGVPRHSTSRPTRYVAPEPDPERSPEENAEIRTILDEAKAKLSAPAGRGSGNALSMRDHDPEAVQAAEIERNAQKRALARRTRQGIHE